MQNGIETMLVLVFYIGDIRYTIKCDKIREIAPMVTLKQAPHTPDYFAGFFNYRGTIVPVLDLCQLIHGCACRLRLSTRIILVDYARKDSAGILGLLAERVTETVEMPESAFSKPGIHSDDAPFLGGIMMEENEMIQYIDLDMLPNCLNLLPMDESATPDGSEDD